MPHSKLYLPNWPRAVLAGVLLAGSGLARESITAGGPAKVEVRQLDGRWRLYVNHQPFYIKGAGLEFGDQEKLAAAGGMASIIRTASRWPVNWPKSKHRFLNIRTTPRCSCGISATN